MEGCKLRPMPSALTSPPPILSDGVVTLRAPRPDDADDITLGCQDPESQLWTTIPVPYSHQNAEEFLALRPTNTSWWQGPLFAVTTPGSDRWSGNIDLRLDDSGGAEVGFMLAPWARGHGHAARALRLLCGWGFSALGLQVVKWCAYVGNEASRQTARTAGFQVPDHVFRAYLSQRGERRDAWIGSITPEDLAVAARLGDARGRYLGPALTRRELDVLRQLTLGRANRTIAAELGISENTVKNHVRSILEKLQAKSRSEAVVTGLRQGLTVLGQ